MLLQVGFFDEQLPRYTKVARKSKPSRHNGLKLSAPVMLPHAAAGGLL
jgi:hypothetical protein